MSHLQNEPRLLAILLKSTSWVRFVVAMAPHGGFGDNTL
jgi:hypothetical protein